MIHRKFNDIFSEHQPQFVLATRNTAAVLLALLLASSLKLESPYWAAMTALIVIQPTRGLLFEKSFYRLLGTAIGSVAGLLLLLLNGSSIVITLALSLWVAGCVGIGNLLYGFRSYACMMAGLTCAVIAMSAYLNPLHLYSLAFGRIADVFIGIIVATAVTALFTPRRLGDNIETQLSGIAAEIVGWLGLMLRTARRGELHRREQDLLITIAEIENRLDTTSADSLGGKAQKRRLQSLIASLLALLAIGRSIHERLDDSHSPSQLPAPWRVRLVGQLEEIADLLKNSKKVSCLSEMTETVAETKSHLPLLGQALDEIVSSLHAMLVSSGTLVAPQGGEPMYRFIRRQDWKQAVQAAIRTALALAAVGTTWAVSGWAQGPMMIMAMAIMLSIFSSKDHPASFVGQIFIGAAIGSMTAVACRLILLPETRDPFLAGIMLAPFILLGVFAMTQRRTAIPATDATLFFIFVTQPGVSITILPHDLVWATIAMMMGVGSAWLSYRYLVPINPAIRLHSNLAAITRDVETMASTADSAKRERLQARMQHRVIRLVSLAIRYDADHLRLVQGGLATLAIGRALQEVHKRSSLLPTAAKIIDDTLGSLSTSARQTYSVIPALEKASIALHQMLVPGLEEDGSTALAATVSLSNEKPQVKGGMRKPCPS